jgi:phosphoglycolate phosphatase-like HAD superfamily hydrolase
MNIYGVIVDVDLKKYPGLTSKQIARSVLLENGFSDEEINPRLDRYMEDLPYSYYNVAWSDKIIVTDGAKELLDELTKRSIFIGIATGEAQRVAKMRLGKVKIDNYFKFGAYGEDGMIFNEILAKSIKIARDNGLQEDEGIVVVANPVSVSIAKILGMKVVALETSEASRKELAAAGADLIIKNFREIDKIIREIKN